jgi:TPR repeat protein
MKRTLIIALIIVATLPLLGTLPPVSQQLNVTAARWVGEGQTAKADAVYRYLSWLGNANARNNRAVLLYCGIGVRRDKIKARAVFEELAEHGNVAARYNLAYLLPARHKSPADVIKRGLSLLQANVDDGDAHSAALMAKRLYFINRKPFVDDRRKKKRSLLALAAASGDADYILLHGKELASQARDLEDKTLMQQAIKVLMEADQKGHPGAGYQLAFQRWQMQPWLKKQGPPAALMENTEFDWWRRSAERGYIYSRCKLGNELFHRAERQLDPAKVSDLETSLRADRIYNRAVSDMREAAQQFKRCLSYRRKKTGKPAILLQAGLRIRKVRPGVPPLRFSRGWANYHLGLMYAAGWGVKKDAKSARKYLERAATNYNFKQAAAALTELQSES